MAKVVQVITLKHGEKKGLKSVYTDSDGDPIDVTSATFTLVVRKNLQTAIIITVNDGDFTKVANIARCNLDTTTLAEDQLYICEVKAIFGADSVDKSDTFNLKIDPAVDGA